MSFRWVDDYVGNLYCFDAEGLILRINQTESGSWLFNMYENGCIIYRCETDIFSDCKENAEEAASKLIEIRKRV